MAAHIIARLGVPERSSNPKEAQEDRLLDDPQGCFQRLAFQLSGHTSRTRFLCEDFYRRLQSLLPSCKIDSR